MICKGCIARQKKLVEFFCRKGEGSMCQKVRARLAKMVGDEPAPAQTYQNRMMTSEPVKTEAPYGYKLDGTPRARPGRQAKVE
jgi:hypothetical protein